MSFAWLLETGTLATLYSVEPFEGSELAAVRRALRMSRQTPHDVTLYRNTDRGQAALATLVARDGEVLRRAPRAA